MQNDGRLEYLDGIRGIAALFVVATHIAYTNLGMIWFGGEWAVSCFIVLSGFCLSLPVQKHGEMRGGLKGFALRRSARILPTYLAAILLTLLLSPLPSIGNLVSHLLLVQNIFPQWVYAFDGASWSMATEWQIYFVFALLIVPAWLRYGKMAAVIVAVLVVDLAGLAHVPRAACFHLLLCFMVGVVAVWLKPDRRFIVAGLAVLVFAVTSHLMDAQWVSQQSPLSDVVFGIGCGMVICGLQCGGSLAQVLACKPLRVVGSFSFSLYLTHMPILAAFPHSTPWPIMVAVVIATAYAFSLAFERPFIVRRSTQAATVPA